MAGLLELSDSPFPDLEPQFQWTVGTLPRAAEPVSNIEELAIASGLSGNIWMLSSLFDQDAKERTTNDMGKGTQRPCVPVASSLQGEQNPSSKKSESQSPSLRVRGSVDNIKLEGQTLESGALSMTYALLKKGKMSAGHKTGIIKLEQLQETYMKANEENKMLKLNIDAIIKEVSLMERDRQMLLQFTLGYSVQGLPLGPQTITQQLEQLDKGLTQKSQAALEEGLSSSVVESFNAPGDLLPASGIPGSRTVKISVDDLPHPEYWDKSWEQRVMAMGVFELLELHKQWIQRSAVLLPGSMYPLRGLNFKSSEVLMSMFTR